MEFRRWKGGSRNVKPFYFFAILFITGVGRLAAQWTRVEDTPSVEIQALHLNADTLYVGVFDQVYFTSDGGTQWTPAAETDPQNDPSWQPTLHRHVWPGRV